MGWGDLGLPRSAPRIEHSSTRIESTRAAVLCPDGHTVLTIGWLTARLWDANTGKPIGQPLKYKGKIRAVAFNTSGRPVVAEVLDGAGLRDSIVRLWDVATAEPVGVPMIHASHVVDVGSVPTVQDLVHTTGGVRPYCPPRFWDALTGKPSTFSIPAEGFVYFAGFSPDGRTILTASGDDKTRCWEARLWDAASGKPIGKPMVHEDLNPGLPYPPKVMADGRTILTRSGDGRIRGMRLPPFRSGVLTHCHTISALTVACCSHIRAVNLCSWMRRRARTSCIPSQSAV